MTAEIGREQPPERAQAFRGLLDMMRRRKREAFGADRRFVAGFEIIDEGDNWRLLAASTVLD